MNTSIPQNIPEYLEHRLGALAEACRLALALDPEGRLKLAVNAELTDADGKRWRVIRFRNDDLALRRRLSKEERCLIWAQPPLTSPDAAIDLSYLPDVVGRLADEQVIDASLLGVLKALMPNEVFPNATPTYAAYFADRLPDLVREHKELREHTRFRPPLSDEHVQALALCCQHQDVKAADLLFRETDLPSALRRYLWLLTEAQWTDDEAVLLRHLARQSPLDEGPKARLAAWLEPGVADALRMVYLRWVAHVAGLTENVAGQIQSTGLCGCDPRALEREWDTVRRWLQDDEFAARFIARAEECFELAELSLMDALLPVDAFTRGGKRLAHLPPAALWRWVVKTATDIPTSATEAAFDLPQTKFSGFARDGLKLRTLCAEVQSGCGRVPEADLGLGELLKAYTDGGIYALELRLAQARGLAKRLSDDGLQERMTRHLERLSAQVRRELHEWDTRLAAALQEDYEGYQQGDVCSIRAIGDLAPERGRVAKDTALWLLVLDGMRLDTWKLTVLPLLREGFAVEQEATYLCALPSHTQMARRALLAGAWTEDWQDWSGKATDKEDILLAVNLELDKEAAQRNLLTVIPADDAALTGKRKPVNLLIYKLSDEWIHSFGQDLAALNEEVERRLKDHVLPVLRSAVLPQDTVLVLSDHGFAELHEDDKVDIGTGGDVEFRAAVGSRVEGAFPVELPDGREASLAIGKTWFRRPGGHRKRYAHGGVSLAEMVVPAARLRVKQVEKCRLELSAPDPLVLTEDAVMPVTLTLRNVGTMPVEFTVSLGCNLVDLPVQPESIPPGRLDAGKSHEIPLKVTARNGLSVLRVQVAYYGGDQHPMPVRHNIPVTVTKRGDQIKLVGLEL